MSRVRRRYLLVVLLALPLIGAVGAWNAWPINWRLRVIGKKLAGGLEAVTWSELKPMLAPGTKYNLQSVLTHGDVFTAIHNPYESAEQPEAGAAIFAARCAICHASDATGDTGPDLTTGEFRRGATDWGIYRTIAHGVPGTPMPAHDLGDRDIWALVSYIRSVSTAALVEADTTSVPAPEVTAERIAGGLDAGEWLTYSGSYDGRRYSPLTQIDRDNVKQLKLLWAFQLSMRYYSLETSPLVAGGTMFLTAPGGGVWALDARTGDPLWSYERPLPEKVLVCCGLVNRGLAILGNTVYLGTIDAHLVALDARNGRVLWDVPVGEHGAGFSITGAPLVVGDKVVTGVAGGEFGIRGFIAAYDAATGERVWQFYTIPSPGEPGSETWEGDSWQTGGAPTWLTGTYDAGLNLIYWGVGNPGPDYNGEARTGDNLYSNSVVALDAATGQLRWHFQFTPHDTRDWDAVQIPVLFDAERDGAVRKLMGWANRNGFYYLLDRETGEYLHGQPYVRQNWAHGLDSIGRPMLAAGSVSSEEGVLTYPAKPGATNWWSPSYSPATGLFYVPTIEAGAIFNRSPVTYLRGTFFLGGRVKEVNQRQFSIRALDAHTGDIRWEFQRSRHASAESRRAGILSTAGGLVITADETVLVALDDRTGKELWARNLGGPIVAAPVTYLLDGEQRVTIAAGRTIFTFGFE